MLLAAKTAKKGQGPECFRPTISLEGSVLGLTAEKRSAGGHSRSTSKAKLRASGNHGSIPRPVGVMERHARALRRLADRLEGLGRGGGAARETLRTLLSQAARAKATSRLESELLDLAAARLPRSEADTLLELPVQLAGATRRVRLSVDILVHHLETMSALLEKAWARSDPDTT